MPPMQRIPRWQNVTATQIEVWAFSQQTLPWLDSRARSSAHSGRGRHVGGTAGILRGWFGSHGHGAHHTQKATGGPAGGSASTLGKSQRGCRQRKPRDAAVRPAAVEVVGGVWAQRSVGVKAHPQGWWCSLSQDRLIWQYKSGSIVCSARPKRDFGVMCAVGCDGSSSSESEAEPYNIWNALLAALVHFRIGGGAAAVANVGRGGLRGIVVPLCLRRAMRRALRLGSSRAWLTSE